MSEELFYIVAKHGVELCGKVRHSTYESARGEAERLAAVSGDRFYVLMAVSCSEYDRVVTTPLNMSLIVSQDTE